MSEPFLAEVRLFGFNFPPRGWAQCDGSILPISQNQSLYSLIGTVYGGDGRTTFGLPDLRGRTPLHEGQGTGLTQRNLGSDGGEERHTLTLEEIPAHSHVFEGNRNQASQNEPGGSTLAAKKRRAYARYAGAPDAGSAVDMHAQTVSSVGNGTAHENMQPFLAVNFCIAMQGLFPSRN